MFLQARKRAEELANLLWKAADHSQSYLLLPGCHQHSTALAEPQASSFERLLEEAGLKKRDAGRAVHILGTPDDRRIDASSVSAILRRSNSTWRGPRGSAGRKPSPANLPQLHPNPAIVAGRELDTGRLKGLHHLCNREPVSLILVFGAAHGVAVDIGPVCEAPNRPFEQTSSGSQLCARHHASA